MLHLADRWPCFLVRVAHVALLLSAVAGSASSADGEETDDSTSWRMDRRVCGVHATYMLLRLHGCDVEYDEVKRELPVDDAGTSLKHMRDALRRRGLAARVVRTDMEHLSQVPLPAVAHLERDVPAEFSFSDRGHYVVVLDIHEFDGVRFIDGSSGMFETKMLGSFFREWSGYMLVVDPGGPPVTQCLMTVACLGIAAGSWWVFTRRGSARRGSREATESRGRPGKP